MVSQECVLFARSVRENIKYGHENASDEEMYRAARMASAHKFIQELPNGYDTGVTQKLSIQQTEHQNGLHHGVPLNREMLLSLAFILGGLHTDNMNNGGYLRLSGCLRRRYYFNKMLL